MKVVILGYIGKRITGIGRVLIATLNKLAPLDRNITYILYTNYDNSELVNYPFPDNVIVKTYPVTRMSSIKNLLFNCFIFPFFLFREHPDVVYVPNFVFIPITFAPVIAVIHDMIEFKLPEKFSKIRMFYRHIIVPLIAKKAKHILTVSENSAKDIVNICNISREKITVVYNAVSDEFKPVVNGKSPLPDNPYMLYVGTVDYPGKNVHNAIRAFEKYKACSCSPLKFVIAGMPGKGFEAVERMMRESDYSDDIVYFGYVDMDMLNKLYTFARIFIFISYYEGFGLPILEAMKFGVPVITSNCSCLPEIAGDSAIICSPDNIDEIALAIKKLDRDEQFRETLIKKGRDNLNRFSWDATARKTLEIIKKVVGETQKWKHR